MLLQFKKKCLVKPKVFVLKLKRVSPGLITRYFCQKLELLLAARKPNRFDFKYFTSKHSYTHILNDSPSEIISTHFEATLKSQALAEKCGKTKTIQIFAIL